MQFMRFFHPLVNEWEFLKCMQLKTFNDSHAFTFMYVIFDFLHNYWNLMQILRLFFMSFLKYLCSFWKFCKFGIKMFSMWRTLILLMFLRPSLSLASILAFLANLASAEVFWGKFWVKIVF